MDEPHPICWTSMIYYLFETNVDKVYKNTYNLGGV